MGVIRVRRKWPDRLGDDSTVVLEVGKALWRPARRHHVEIRLYTFGALPVDGCCVDGIRAVAALYRGFRGRGESVSVVQGVETEGNPPLQRVWAVLH